MNNPTFNTGNPEQVGQGKSTPATIYGSVPGDDHVTCLCKFAETIGVDVPVTACGIQDLVKALKELPEEEFRRVEYRKCIISTHGVDDYDQNHIGVPTRADLEDPDLNISTKVPILGDFIITMRGIIEARWLHAYKVYADVEGDSRFEETDDERTADPESGYQAPRHQPARGPQHPLGQGGAGQGRQGGGNAGYQTHDRSGSTAGPGDRGATVSPNLGLSRRTGAKRVVGGGAGVKKFNPGVSSLRSYAVASGVQFNDYAEMRLDAISREYAQEIIEDLFLTRWSLDLSDSVVAKKAEDMLHAFMIVRTASPYADYSLYAVIGKVEVDFMELSDALKSREITRRQFARAIADDLRTYVRDPDNAGLRDKLVTLLGVQSQYVHLAFDGSTDCSGMSRHEIAFTKSLESNGLFDDESVQGKLSNASLLDSNFTTSATPQRRRAPI